MKEGEGRIGTLFLVSTPIGNMEDVTIRALRILKEVDAVIAEDSRQSKKLLERYDVQTPLTKSYYQGAEDRAEELVGRLKSGENLALISDAGTPLISDPGFKLVRLARREGVPVRPVPGPTAAIAALIASGKPTDSFVFEGMIPRREGPRRELLEKLRTERRTAILYESPHRIMDTLKTLQQVSPDRSVTLCRELTKKYEETIEGKPDLVLQKLKEKDAVKGEITLVMEGASEEEILEEKREKYAGLSFSEQFEALQKIQGMERKEAMKRLARLRGMSKNEVYDKLLEEKEQ